jgi:hypothetical protein
MRQGKDSIQGEREIGEQENERSRTEIFENMMKKIMLKQEKCYYNVSHEETEEPIFDELDLIDAEINKRKREKEIESDSYSIKMSDFDLFSLLWK